MERAEMRSLGCAVRRVVRGLRMSIFAGLVLGVLVLSPRGESSRGGWVGVGPLCVSVWLLFFSNVFCTAHEMLIPRL